MFPVREVWYTVRGFLAGPLFNYSGFRKNGAMVIAKESALATFVDQPVVFMGAGALYSNIAPAMVLATITPLLLMYPPLFSNTALAEADRSRLKSTPGRILRIL